MTILQYVYYNERAIALFCHKYTEADLAARLCRL